MATRADIFIDQGSVFYADVVLKDENGDPIDLDGYTAVSQVRKSYTSVNATATFGTSVNVESSSISLSLNANQSSSMPSGRYVYDVEITDGLETLRVVEGIVTVTPEVTR